MSRFLVQSKNFLPLVIQKSTTEAVQVLEKHPSLSTSHREELPTTQVSKQEQIQKENLKIVLNKNHEIPKIVAVQFARNRTLTEAFILDLKQVQMRLLHLTQSQLMLLWKQLLRTTERLVKGQVTLVRRPGSGFPASLVWIDGQPQLQPKETEPAPVILPEMKKKMEPQFSGPRTVKFESKANNKSEKSEKQSEDRPPMSSKLWETVQEKSPEWQISISNHLADLQKTVIQKFPK